MTNAVDVITLPEAKTFLNIPAATTTSDTELASFITAASQAWVRRVGPTAGSPTFDEWYDGGRPSIVLRNTPVQSVTAVTESFSTSLAYTLNAEVLDGTSGGDAYGYTLDKDRGLLIRRANGVPISFAAGRMNVRVTYVAGYATVPEDIKFAVKALLGQMWETQRGGGTRPGSTPDATMPMSLWPARAQAVASSYLIPGIA